MPVKNRWIVVLVPPVSGNQVQNNWNMAEITANHKNVLGRSRSGTYQEAKNAISIGKVNKNNRE